MNTKLHMIKRIALISLCFFSLYGMQKSLPVIKPEQSLAAVTLKRGENTLHLNLESALTHICGYQRVLDPITSQEKIAGLHHYHGLIKRLRTCGLGTVVELSDSLWIYIDGDRNSFHAGYLIYQGRVLLDQPKTFFPCTWSKERLITAIQQAAHSEKIVWHEQCTGSFKTVCATGQYENVSIKFVIKQYPHKRILRTIYPEISVKQVKESVLEELAQEQAALLRTVRHSRFSLMAEHAKRHLEKNQENLEKPELLTAVEWALNPEADPAYWYDEISECLRSGANPNVSDAQGRTPLMLAAQHADQMLITALSEAGASHEHKDKNGRTMLEYALHSYKESAVLPFLNASNPQALNRLLSTGVTPLIYAIDKFSIELVDLLLEYGADPNMPDSLGFTPLMHAVRRSLLSEEAILSTLAIIKILLERGADIDFQRRDLRTINVRPVSREADDTEEAGDTALMHAVMYGNERVVKTLLDAQADYTILNEKRQNALKIAHNKKVHNVIAVLEKFIKEKEDWIRAQGADELIYAAYQNNVTRVRKILQLIRHNKINCRINGNGCKDTALYYVVDHNTVDLVIDLLRAGADPRLSCSHNCTILQYAQAREVSADIVVLLEERAHELNAPKNQAQKRAEERRKQAIEQFKAEVEQDQVTARTLEAIKEIPHCLVDGQSPLLYAIKKGKIQTIEKLAKLKLRSDNENLLFLPENKNEKEILKIILRNGCADEKHQMKLLREALKKERRDVLSLFSTIQNFYVGQFKTAIENGDQDLVTAICRFDTVLTFEQAAGCLVLAINRGRHAIAEVLAEQYPLVVSSYKDSETGMTPLMSAAAQSMVELCKKLINLGADMDARDARERSVMDHVPQKSAEGKKLREVFEKRKKEAETATERDSAEQPDRKNLISKGWTPAMAAAYYGDSAVLATCTKVEINKGGPEGLTPLHIAVIHKKNGSLAELLQRSDVDICSKDAAGLTPLQHAVRHDNETAVRLLLAKKASIFSFDNSGKHVFSEKRPNTKASRIRDTLRAALIKEAVNDTRPEMPHEMRVMLNGMAPEERNLSYEILFSTAEASEIERLVQKSEIIRLELSMLIGRYCREIITLGISGEGDTDRKARAFFEALDAAKIELIIKNGLEKPSLLIYPAIVLEHGVLLNYLFTTCGDQMKSWKLDLFKKEVLLETMKKISNENPELNWYEPLIDYESLVVELSPAIWAWLLKKKAALRLFFEKTSSELHREIEPCRVPAWVFLLSSYHADAELGELITAWLQTDEQARRFLQDRTATSHLARQNFWHALGLLLTEKKIDAHIRDSGDNTLIMNALEGYRNMTKADSNAEAWLHIFVTDLIEKFQVDCNRANKQGMSPFECALRQNLYDLVCYLILLPHCTCQTTVPLPAQVYWQLVRDLPVWKLCALLKQRPDLLREEDLALAAVVERNIDLLSVLLNRLSDTALETIVASACQRGDDKIVKLLIDKGKIQPNKIYRPSRLASRGGTPLMMATVMTRRDVALQLLKVAGTDTSIQHPELHQTAAQMTADPVLRKIFETHKNGAAPQEVDKAYEEAFFNNLMTQDFTQAEVELRNAPSTTVEAVRQMLMSRYKFLVVKHLALPTSLVLHCPQTAGFPIKALSMHKETVLYCLPNGIVGRWDVGSRSQKGVEINFERLRDRQDTPCTVTAFEVSSDGKYIVTGFDNGSIVITYTDSKLSNRIQVVSEQIMSLAFTKVDTTTFCVFFTKNGSINQFEIVDLAQQNKKKFTTTAVGLGYCPEQNNWAKLMGNKRLLAVGQDGHTLKVYSLSQPGHHGMKIPFPINAVVQWGDSNNLAIAAGNKLMLGNVFQEQVRYLKEEKAPITHLALSKDGKTMLHCTAEQILTLWNFAGLGMSNDFKMDGKSRIESLDLAPYPLGAIRCMALSDDGKHVALGFDNGIIQLIDLKILETLDPLYALFVCRYLTEGQDLLKNTTAQNVLNSLPPHFKEGLLKHTKMHSSPPRS